MFEGDDGERFERNWLYWTGNYEEHYSIVIRMLIIFPVESQVLACFTAICQERRVCDASRYTNVSFAKSSRKRKKFNFLFLFTSCCKIGGQNVFADLRVFRSSQGLVGSCLSSSCYEGKIMRIHCNLPANSNLLKNHFWYKNKKKVLKHFSTFLCDIKKNIFELKMKSENLLSKTSHLWHKTHTQSSTFLL